jgi:hypothetical protein
VERWKFRSSPWGKKILSHISYALWLQSSVMCCSTVWYTTITIPHSSHSRRLQYWYSMPQEPQISTAQLFSTYGKVISGTLTIILYQFPYFFFLLPRQIWTCDGKTMKYRTLVSLEFRVRCMSIPLATCLPHRKNPVLSHDRKTSLYCFLKQINTAYL